MIPASPSLGNKVICRYPGFIPYQIECSIFPNIIVFFIKTLHIIEATNNCFYSRCDTHNSLNKLCLYSLSKMIKAQLYRPKHSPRPE